MQQVQGVLEAVAGTVAQPPRPLQTSERAPPVVHHQLQAALQPQQTVLPLQAPQVVQRLQVALQQQQTVSPLQAQVAQTLATFGQFLPTGRLHGPNV